MKTCVRRAPTIGLNASRAVLLIMASGCQISAPLLQAQLLKTALVTLLVVAAVKFVLVRFLLGIDVPRELLQAQDAVITGALAGVLVWVFLIAERVRRKQEEEQLRVVSDLNHHLRNALEVIFASDYLRESEKATAILESVERIDATLQILLPQTPASRSTHWWKIAQDVRPEQERRKSARTRTQQQVAVRVRGNGQEELTGTVRDVSASGMFVHLEREIAVGTAIEILLTLPAEVGEFPTPLRGKVVRMETVTVGRSGIGIAFAVS